MVGQVDEGRLVAGRYRLLERIGRGGMGTVWLAEDELLGRQVAVKKLHPPQPHMHDDELATLFERTRREARAAARISHPNVIVVHDVVDDDGLPSIVMEYVPSVTLGERLKEHGALAPAEAARIGRGMVAALRAAHRAGVLHRDVKPGNVLLGADGRVVLTDFGIAQASGTSTLTRTGEIIGSIDFLAPERIRGAVPGPEADLWALGATLYQAVEGQSPFRRPTAIETAYAIAEEPVVPAPNAGALTQVIAGLLAKEPAERLSAEDAEAMLRMPAADQETARVGRDRFESPQPPPVAQEPPTAEVSRQPIPYQPGGYPPGAHGYSSGTHDSGAHLSHGHPSGTYPPFAAPPPDPALPPEPPRRRRTAAWIAGALIAAVLAAGAVVAATHYGSKDAGGPDGGTTGGPVTPVTTPPVVPPSGPPTTGPNTTAPTTPPPTTTPAPPPVPDGYHLAEQPDRGYSVPVPDGWTRTVKDGGDEVNWVDPTGLVALKFSALDFASTSPYQHWLTLEPATRGNVDGYHRERLDPTVQSGDPAAIWQFTFKGSVRDFRAIDLGFGKPGGREYAIYLVAPKADWETYRPVFDIAVAGFRQTGQ